MDQTKTVGELIELLSRYPHDTPVWTEGCDCIGNVDDVSYEPTGYCVGVLIERNN